MIYVIVIKAAKITHEKWTIDNDYGRFLRMINVPIVCLEGYSRNYIIYSIFKNEQILIH